MSYHKTNVNLSKYQINKIIKAIKNDEEISLNINNNSPITTYLMLTNNDINRLKLGKNVKLSKT